MRESGGDAAMNALSPSHPDRPPHGLRSLWDLMQRFDASKFVEISNWLAQLHDRLVPGQWVGLPVDEHESLVRHAEIREQLRADP